MKLNLPEERKYIFEHVVRQVAQKFYVTNLHGVDWEFYRQAYSRFLPYIDNNVDFAELLSEMLGELNASHTGARFSPRRGVVDETASLGIYPDLSHSGPGIKIAEVLDKGPLKGGLSEVKAGHILEKIDGEEIGIADPDPLLNRKAGKTTLLTFFDPEANRRWDQVIKPITLGEERELLFERWIKSRRVLTEKLSQGRIGYVHVRSMNDASFRKVFSELLGRHSDKEAVVIDTRFNGGGWLHDDLIDLLSGRTYFTFVPRGVPMGEEPRAKWRKPSIVLMSEDNYSNAHMFPLVYKKLGLGKLVGMPVPGTGTAVWWETQQDQTLVFGIPQVGVMDTDGHYLENQQLEPDIRVVNDPESLAEGRDPQLEKAVETLLNTKK
jgi:C-terminal processing protease CtpA/Prc